MSFWSGVKERRLGASNRSLLPFLLVFEYVEQQLRKRLNFQRKLRVVVRTTSCRLVGNCASSDSGR